jgi:hypothetical protein
MVYMWWSKIEIRIYSSLEIKQELNCESALSECNDEHLQMCICVCVDSMNIAARNNKLNAIVRMSSPTTYD